VNKVELQLAGLKFCDDLGTSAPLIDEMPLMQKPLAKTVVTLPGTTIVEEFCRRSRVTLRSTPSLPTATSKKVELLPCHMGGRAVYAKGESNAGNGDQPQLAAAEAKKQALSNAIFRPGNWVFRTYPRGC